MRIRKNGISYRKTAKTKDSEKFILPKEVVEHYESGRNVVFYCHKGRRKKEDWEQASFMRAHTVYIGYYIDLEKMDEDLEEGWQELLNNGITVSRRQIK